jgi:hypothetical protein
MIKFFINRILAWVAGLTSSDFKTAVALAQNAEEQFSESANKREYVLGALKSNFPKVATWALGLLLELAVSYIKSKQSK